MPLLRARATAHPDSPGRRARALLALGAATLLLPAAAAAQGRIASAQLEATVPAVLSVRAELQPRERSAPGVAEASLLLTVDANTPWQLVVRSGVEGAGVQWRSRPESGYAALQGTPRVAASGPPGGAQRVVIDYRWNRATAARVSPEELVHYTLVER